MKEVVFSRKNLILVRKKYGYIVINLSKPFSCGHTHVHSRDLGVVIIKNVVQGRLPRSNNIKTLYSHLRVASDPSYIKAIEEKINQIQSK